MEINSDIQGKLILVSYVRKGQVTRLQRHGEVELFAGDLEGIYYNSQARSYPAGIFLEVI